MSNSLPPTPPGGPFDPNQQPQQGLPYPQHPGQPYGQYQGPPPGYQGGFPPPAPPEPKPKKSFFKKKRFIIPAALVTLGIIGAATGGGGDTDPKVDTSKPAAAAASKPTPTATPSPPAPAEPAAPAPTEPAPAETTEAAQAPTPPAPLNLVKAQVYKGTGNKIVKFKEPLSEARLMTTTWSGGDGNIIIYAVDSEGEEGDLLVNDIDSYTGQTVLNLAGDDLAGLKIQGGGSWKITLQDLAVAKRWDGTGTFAGKSDGVLIVKDAFEALDSITFKSTGADGNIVVHSYDSDGNEDLLVNDIGNFTAENLAGKDTVLLVVNSDGKWTMKKS